MTDPADPNQPPPYGKGGDQPQPQQPGGYGPPPGGYPQQPGGYGPPPGGYQQQPGGYPPPGGYQQAPVSQADEKLWAMLGHLGGIVLGFVAGLVVYLIYKDRSHYLKEQGAEAFNFQITVLIGIVAGSIITFVLALVTGGLLAFVNLGFLAWVAGLVLAIVAGLAANRHENYRYPFALRLLK